MKYTVKDLRTQFPTDDACLTFVFEKKKPPGKWYRIRGRPEYRNSKGKHFSPLKGTIFEGSDTPLTLWFYALYLFSQEVLYNSLKLFFLCLAWG